MVLGDALTLTTLAQITFKRWQDKGHTRDGSMVVGAQGARRVTRGSQTMVIIRGQGGRGVQDNTALGDGSPWDGIGTILAWTCIKARCQSKREWEPPPHHLPAWPLGLLLCPTVSGGRDILHVDWFRTKLIYTPPSPVCTSVEFYGDYRQHRTWL